MFYPREHKRVKQTTQISARILTLPGAATPPEEKFPCTTQDLSLGGARLTSHTEIRFGAVLELNIALKDPEIRFLMKAQVVWVRAAPREHSFTFGAQFVDASPDTLQEWQRVIGQVMSRRAAEPPEDSVDWS